MSEPVDNNSQVAPTAGVRELTSSILEFARPQLLSTVLIVTLAAVLEGAGIVLILPVAETVFAQSEGEVNTGISASITQWLTSVGFDTVLEQLAVMGAGFLLLVTIRGAVMLQRDVLLSELSFGYVDHERQKFFLMLAQAEWPIIKRYRKAQLLNTMTTNIARLAQTMHFLTRGLITATLGAAAIGAAFLVSTSLGLLLLLLTVAGLLFALVWSRRSYRAGERLNKANRWVMHETTRFLDGLKAAKAARAEDVLAEGYKRQITDTRELSITFVRQQARLRNGIQFVAALAALLVLLLGFGWLGLSGGELLVMAAIILRLAPALLSTFSGVQSLAHALPAFASIRSLEAELAEAHAGLRVPPQEGLDDELEQAATAPLELRGCSVSAVDEDGNRVTLVEAGRITIAPGTLVHIGGPSGAGKSSLAELVAGLHLPASGEVRRGSLHLAPDTCRAWQSQVSFAPQEPFLFDGSIRENLSWPNLSPDDDAIWQALADAQAAELVRSLPQGLDEQLLDGGARLSGGERQRLCIARALLRPASLLIFDEATSAMDPELERAIVSRLRETIGQRIVLMVSHSRNTLDLADMRIDVAAGVARVVS
ncbi:ABC transporter ATP-binding protein [Aurantiacibacter sp. MUD11]|uniref:ATP-binding cassette domain-containing protein n=1 Tax=Aurantiacibacter sp. MUD11 TaxID=3003265 RepID=UPI0022AB08BE|nr:ABC transporter ATP-binding protein [Aurantiacibacter sp. MUD11]WAT18918.1 ABC transporter ATP-binding protein [Aurantiacibacter sp. MUD11]